MITIVKRAVHVVSVGFAAIASPAMGQRMLDWPVRVDVTPAALQRGAAAAFANPAGIAISDGRGEVVLVDGRTPDAIGVRSLSAAAVARHARWTLGASIQHIGVEDLQRTGSSPIDGAEDLDISEDLFTISAAYTRNSMQLGAGARWDRLGLGNGAESSAVGTAGLVYNPTLPLMTRFALSGEVGKERRAMFGGLEIHSPVVLNDWRARAQYGVAFSDAEYSTEHTLAARVEFKGLVSVSAAAVRSDQANGNAWSPHMAASLRFQRYTLGITRESLLNDFGTAYAFRLLIRL